MSFNRYIFIILFFFYGCDQSTKNNFLKDNIKIENRYQNSGFALIYDDNSAKTKALEPRSLDIYHKTLKKKSMIKITNPKNGKSLIANVKSNKVKFSEFYNSIISDRIVEDLELDREDPFIKIVLISKNSMFVAKKTKTFDEEKNVAEKAPVLEIGIKDLSDNKTAKVKKPEISIFKYVIKLGDFYFYDSAMSLKQRVKNEFKVNEVKINKLSKTKFRVYLGPYDNLNSLKNAFNKISILNFENIEIIKI